MSLPTLPNSKLYFQCGSCVDPPNDAVYFAPFFFFFASEWLSPLVKFNFYCIETAWANKNRCTFYICFFVYSLFLFPLKLTHFLEHFLPPLDATFHPMDNNKNHLAYYVKCIQINFGKTFQAHSINCYFLTWTSNLLHFTRNVISNSGKLLSWKRDLSARIKKHFATWMTSNDIFHHLENLKAKFIRLPNKEKTSSFVHFS